MGRGVVADVLLFIAVLLGVSELDIAIHELTHGLFITLLGGSPIVIIGLFQGVTMANPGFSTGGPMGDFLAYGSPALLESFLAAALFVQRRFLTTADALAFLFPVIAQAFPPSDLSFLASEGLGVMVVGAVLASAALGGIVGIAVARLRLFGA